MKQISLRLTDEELDHLKRYCDIKKRQQGELIREFIRGLPVPSPPKEGSVFPPAKV